MKVGIVALQGDVEEHAEAFRNAAAELGIAVEVVEVKKPRQLEEVRALALTGGESTTIGILAKRAGLIEPVRKAVEGGLPTLGTCAGAVLLAKEVRDAVVGETGQPTIGVMDIAVVRNAFGRQRESFEAELEVEGFGKIRAVFIRAPAVVKAWGSAKPLAPVRHASLGLIYTAAVEGNILATAFHPELTTIAFHRRVLEMALGRA
ncbi:MAG: pyridoxal 5'-phosphate synthase glutaminase subunit PdxT [Pyrobaculum sp.]